MGYYIRRPVEDAVIRIIDKEGKMQEKYTDPEQMMADIAKQLEHKTKEQLTYHELRLIIIYFEIYDALYPDYESEFYHVT